MTEVGVIPEDWNVALLGDKATFKTGPFGSSLHKSDYVHDEIPIINPMHIVGGSIKSSPNMTVSKSTAQRLIDFQLRAGEIVIGRRGDMGRCAVVEDPQAGWLCGTGSMIIRSLAYNASFLQRVLSSPQAIYAIEEASVGTTMVNLNQATLAKLPLVFPAPQEQRAIAKALSDVDALLNALDRLIVKKRDLKQAAMQQLLTGKTRLPGFDNEGVRSKTGDSGGWASEEDGVHVEVKPGYKLTEVGVIPEDWEVSTVGEQFEIQLGKMLDAEKNEGALKPYLGNRAVQWDYINAADLPVVALSPSDMLKYRLKKGDLLVCEGGEVGRAAIWDSPVEECYYQKALHRLRPKKGFEVTLMPAMLRAWSESGKLANHVTQTSIAHLPKDKFSLVPMVLPPRSEQLEIVRVLQEMNSEITALESRRQKTHHLKQGMMQELLTGKTRLLEPETHNA